MPRIEMAQAIEVKNQLIEPIAESVQAEVAMAKAAPMDANDT